jgi:hypothetical protein
MKKQIKQEEIISYLPYGLKFQSSMDKPFKEFGKNPIWTLDGIHKMFGDYCLLTKENNDAYIMQSCKLILHPLSDLKNKDLDYWIEFSQAIDEMSTDYLIDALVNGTFYSRDIHFSFKLLQVLYSMHFDIHNLIERGLAIDINTLK